MIEVKNVTKTYGKKTALQRFSCTLGNGICGLLGPNGAGKSTLMKLMSDNLSRDCGEILYNGQDILKLGPSYRSVLGYMPQQQGMYENMTAIAFLFYIANLKGIHNKLAKTQIEHLLSVVNLTAVSHRKLYTFSIGMRQRIMLVQALLGNPDIIILDEPTVGLDPQERVKLCTYLGSIATEKTILWSTHIVKEIESIASTIAIIKEGQLLVHGSIDDVKSATSSKSLESAYMYYMGDTNERI